MPVKINNIDNKSLAEYVGILKDDLVVEINEHKILDFIDFQYYVASDYLEILINRKGNFLLFEIERDESTPLGIELYPHKVRTCANNCIFCFVDQNKEGLRNTLSIKDDDYLFSFLYGNFITLTNVTDLDIQKIITQKLSPLYISVHVTDKEMHKKTLRYKHDFDLLEKLKILSENGIEFHTQLVLVPNWNDGNYLQKSIEELSNSNLNTLSIGIVPVGLTKYRANLSQMRTFQKEEAQRVIDIVHSLRETLIKDNFWCSDEFYMLAEETIPEKNFYIDYSQIENGIGIIRKMLDNWRKFKDNFIKEISNLDENLVFLCGTSIAPIIQNISDEINSILGSKATSVQPIVNYFYGETVTVTGLLTATDITSQYKSRNNEIPIVCTAIFNNDNITLDQVSKEDLIEQLESPVLFVDEFYDKWELLD